MTNRRTVQFKRLVSTSPAAPGERFVSDPDRQAAADVGGESAVNVKATLSPDDLARACAEAMWKEDVASKGLGMEILQIKAGAAPPALTVPPPPGTRAPSRPVRLPLPSR